MTRTLRPPELRNGECPSGPSALAAADEGLAVFVPADAFVLLWSPEDERDVGPKAVRPAPPSCVRTVGVCCGLDPRTFGLSLEELTNPRLVVSVMTEEGVDTGFVEVAV
jgi:hypothetical protein